ncbi:hypothetical protein KQX54_021038 [Cotesia glomerata]|uniref:Uncharacterized protein n=1 Tax=Cotesia glomerata TaxID=32391 RepID=A0AAV7J994_COTGL|nr:hypothetical protein KQX54_021038 [Cotesia glomerata]
MYNTTPIQEAPPKMYTFFLPSRPFGAEVTPGSGRSMSDDNDAYLINLTEMVSLIAEEFANRKPNDSGNLPLSLSQSFRDIDLAVEVVGCRWIATTPQANPVNGED